jgi:hypothetical protein
MTDDPFRFLYALPGKPSLCECLKAAVEYHNAQNDPNSATRSSLIKLAHTSIQLHAKALANGIQAWPDGEGPLSVAVAALKTVAKNEGVLR